MIRRFSYGAKEKRKEKYNMRTKRLKTILIIFYIHLVYTLTISIRILLIIFQEKSKPPLGSYPEYKITVN